MSSMDPMRGRFLDTVRNTAKNFASTVSLSSTARHKVIIIDEADNTTNDVQLLLRAFTEEFQWQLQIYLHLQLQKQNHRTTSFPLRVWLIFQPIPKQQTTTRSRVLQTHPT